MEEKRAVSLNWRCLRLNTKTMDKPCVARRKTNNTECGNCPGAERINETVQTLLKSNDVLKTNPVKTKEKDNKVETHKTCSTCNKKKLLTEFIKTKDKKSGYGGTCKACKNKQVQDKKETLFDISWLYDTLNFQHKRYENLIDENNGKIEKINKEIEGLRKTQDGISSYMKAILDIKELNKRVKADGAYILPKIFDEIEKDVFNG